MLSVDSLNDDAIDGYEVPLELTVSYVATLGSIRTVEIVVLFKICMMLVGLKTSVIVDVDVTGCKTLLGDGSLTSLLTAGVVRAGKTAVDVNAVGTELEDVDSEVSTWDDALPSPRSTAKVLAGIKVVRTVLDEITPAVECNSLLDVSASVSAVVVEVVSRAVLLGIGKVDELTKVPLLDLRAITTVLLELTVVDKVAILCTADCTTDVELAPFPLKYCDGLIT